MYEVILENATGRLTLQFRDEDGALLIASQFERSKPFNGDRRSYRIYNPKGKMIHHEEFA